MKLLFALIGTVLSICALFFYYVLIAIFTELFLNIRLWLPEATQLSAHVFLFGLLYIVATGLLGSLDRTTQAWQRVFGRE